jgi:hypothetical protein
VRTQLLSDDQDIAFLIGFAFIPARYDSSAGARRRAAGRLGAEIWTFAAIDSCRLTFVNAVWLLPFGSAVARPVRRAAFIAFFAVTAAAGGRPCIWPPMPASSSR